MIKFFKRKIKNQKTLFWSFFHPDNIFNLNFANDAENLAWNFVTKNMNNYSSICELGCFNGRSTFVLRKFLQRKIYIGYDLNIFAISIARFFNFFIGSNRKFFYCKNATKSFQEDCELFISIATLIYFSEKELKIFINNLKENKLFKVLLMHEIFLNESYFKEKKSFSEDDLNIHSISMIKEEFGNKFKVDTIRTYYPSWEKKNRISAILCIQKNTI